MMDEKKIVELQERVRSLDELTESREMMASQPHPFLPFFILLTLTLLSAALGWSYFAKFEIVEKVNGVVRPVSNQSVVQNIVGGNIKAIHYQEGQEVEGGEILYEVNVETVQEQYDELLAMQSELEEERLSLQQLAQSIIEEENLLANEETEAYYRYKGFEVELQNSQVAAEETYQSTEAQASDLRSEVTRLEENLARREEDVAAYQEVMRLLTQSESSKVTAAGKPEETGEENLQTEMTLEPSHPMYGEYTAYLHQVDALETERDEAGAKYNVYRTLDEETRYTLISRQEYESMQRSYEQASANLAQYKADYLGQIQQGLKEQQRLMQEERLQLDQLHQSLREQEKMLDLQSEYISLHPEQVRFGSYEVVQQEIQAIDERLSGINQELLQLQERLNQAVVRAPISGVVNFVNEKNPGDFVAVGEEMLRIGPPLGGEFEMQMLIPNDLAGEVNVGDRVRYSILAYDYRDYGYLEGEVTQVSQDSSPLTNAQADQEQASYYLGWASIHGNALKNKQGQIGELKPGMLSEVKLVVREERALTTFLRAINFID